MTVAEVQNQMVQQKKRSGLTASLAAKFDMEPGMFLETIKKTVMPATATNEEVAAFLMVAREYDMNPLLREIHAFPKKGGGIQTVVGVDGWAKIITRNPDFDGVEFEYQDDGKKPVSVTCVLYRKSCGRPTKVTEYFEECKRNTEPWNTMPRRMLRHKSLMQCGRIAFGLSGIVDEDEARDFCEVDAKVVAGDDDLLSPGRHSSRKPQQTKPEPLGEPEETPETEEPTQEETAQTIPEPQEPETDACQPDACADYRELFAANGRSKAMLARAIETARGKHRECEKVKEFCNIDYTDEDVCGLILTEFRRLKDLAKGKAGGA